MSQDKKDLFAEYWRMLHPEMPQPVTEYRFGAMASGGIGKGLRARLKKTGFQDWRFDWAWPQYRIAVEVDGGQWSKFGGRHMTDADREKTNAAADLRWFVYHYSPDQLKKSPAQCIEQVYKAIKAEM